MDRGAVVGAADEGGDGRLEVLVELVVHHELGERGAEVDGGVRVSVVGVGYGVRWLKRR